MVPPPPSSGLRDSCALVAPSGTSGCTHGCHLSPDKAELRLSLLSLSFCLAFTEGPIQRAQENDPTPLRWSHRREGKAAEVTFSFHFPLHLAPHLRGRHEVKMQGVQIGFLPPPGSRGDLPRSPGHRV